MSGMSRIEIAAFKLQDGQITKEQYLAAYDKLKAMDEMDEPTAPTAPAPEAPTVPPLLLASAALPTIAPPATPLSSPSTPSAQQSSASDLLGDYLKSHPEPHPNHPQPIDERTAHPASAIKPAAQPSTTTDTASQIDRMVAASR